MTTSTDDREIRQDVMDVLVRYATGIDRKDWGLLRTCFTDDCHCDYGAIGTWAGADAVVDFMERTHPDGMQSLHRITNMAVSREGDAVVARSYVDLIYVGGDGASGMKAMGYYDDEFACAEDGWKIARRRFTPVYSSPIRRG